MPTDANLKIHIHSPDKCASTKATARIDARQQKLFIHDLGSAVAFSISGQINCVCVRIRLPSQL